MKISGPTEAKPGDNVTLTCTTSNSNPKAEIAWFKGGESVEALYTYSPTSPDGGWTTQSNVSIPIYETDRSIIVTCQGVNKGLGESKVASHTINVIRKCLHINDHVIKQLVANKISHDKYPIKLINQNPLEDHVSTKQA